ncbi:MAG TPA: hypothetical protein VJN92_22935 [Candidatus Acidoferrum sp.]|nr:hypothetical protein [Candidatus Acidoferrum sp.]
MVLEPVPGSSVLCDFSECPFQAFWTLDVYPTRAAAEADKGPRGTVLESLGKVWLLSIEYEKSKLSHGSRTAEIGPLSIVVGEKYSVQFMEAIFNLGMTAPEHLHSGPEAWYTQAGETCLETSDGHVQIGRAGGPQESASHPCSYCYPFFREP